MKINKIFCLSEETYELLKKIENKSAYVDALIFKDLNPKRYQGLSEDKLNKLLELENKRQELAKQLNEVNHALSQ